jgi:hypothetical protein
VIGLNRKSAFGRRCIFLGYGSSWLDVASNSPRSIVTAEPEITVNPFFGACLDQSVSGSNPDTYRFTPVMTPVGTDITLISHCYVFEVQCYGTTGFGSIVSLSDGNDSFRIAHDNNAARTLYLTKGGVGGPSVGVDLSTHPWRVVINQNGATVSGYALRLDTTELTLLSGDASGSLNNDPDPVVDIGRGNVQGAPMYIGLVGVAETSIPDSEQLAIVHNPGLLFREWTRRIPVTTPIRDTVWTEKRYPRHQSQ